MKTTPSPTKPTGPSKDGPRLAVLAAVALLLIPGGASLQAAFRDPAEAALDPAPPDVPGATPVDLAGQAAPSPYDPMAVAGEARPLAGGILLADEFVVPAGTKLVAGGDLVVEARAILVLGSLVGAPGSAPGADGASITLRASESVEVHGLVASGSGAPGRSVSWPGEEAQPGGDGGRLVLGGPGSVRLAPSGRLATGDGGEGGSAFVTQPVDGLLSATGAAGGDAGDLEVPDGLALRGIQLGDGGDGGRAFAAAPADAWIQKVLAVGGSGGAGGWIAGVSPERMLAPAQRGDVTGSAGGEGGDAVGTASASTACTGTAGHYNNGFQDRNGGNGCWGAAADVYGGTGGCTDNVGQVCLIGGAGGLAVAEAQHGGTGGRGADGQNGWYMHYIMGAYGGSGGWGGIGQATGGRGGDGLLAGGKGGDTDARGGDGGKQGDSGNGGQQTRLADDEFVPYECDGPAWPYCWLGANDVVCGHAADVWPTTSPGGEVRAYPGFGGSNALGQWGPNGIDYGSMPGRDGRSGLAGQYLLPNCGHSLPHGHVHGGPQ